MTAHSIKNDYIDIPGSSGSLHLIHTHLPTSVPRVSALLCRHNATELVYLGQRYGYRLHAPDGFNYHTGGAGIVLSLPLVRLIVQRCSCPSASAPDDMILGYCLKRWACRRYTLPECIRLGRRTMPANCCNCMRR